MKINKKLAKERFIEVSRRNNLDPDILKQVLWYRNRGINTSKVASTMEVSRNTAYKYTNALSQMEEEDIKTLLVIIALEDADEFLLTFAHLLLKD